jgi:hypothetical protein
LVVVVLVLRARQTVVVTEATAYLAQSQAQVAAVVVVDHLAVLVLVTLAVQAVVVVTTLLRVVQETRLAQAHHKETAVVLQVQLAQHRAVAVLRQ